MATIRWTGDTDGDLSKAANYSPNQVPTDDDTLVFQLNAVSVDTGMATLAAVTLAKLVIDQSYTGQIGTADEYMEVGAKLVDIGQHYGAGTEPAGSGRIKLDINNAGSFAPVITVYNTGSPSDDGQQAVRLLTAHASTEINVLKGSVSIAPDAAETSTVSSLDVSYVDSKDSDADVVVGEGVTLATVNQTGGNLALRCAATTITKRGGFLRTAGTGAITTTNNYDGDAALNATGAITTLNGYGGSVDFTESRAARTVTTCNVYASFTLTYDPAVVTVTNKPSPAEPVRLSAEAV